MAVTGKLAVKRRIEHGSRECRRLRDSGFVPGNVYGHKQETIPLTVAAAELEPLVRGGARVLDVELEGKLEKVLFREVQWDYLGRQVVHFDLLRVDPNETLTLEVKVELKGTAPGAVGGGVLDHTLRTLTVECLAIQIPDSIPVKISALEIGQALHVRDLEIPPNTKVLNNPDAVVVRVAQPGAELEIAPAAVGEEGPAQPEVIGRKAAEAEEEGEAEADKEKEKKK
ncbi:MAG TPA: 50S ribosomal protein L25 [Planctomycetaceae bacterium]|nr:50S ribosomal protein L25 [Planctomycetaceae bacterium]